MPPLRYVVGAGSSELAETIRSTQLRPLTPIADAAVAGDAPLDFSWVDASPRSAFFRIEVRNSANDELLSAIVPRGTGIYRAPSWLREKASGSAMTWRVVSLDLLGREVTRSEWRAFTFATGPTP